MANHEQSKTVKKSVTFSPKVTTMGEEDNVGPSSSYSQIKRNTSPWFDPDDRQLPRYVETGLVNVTMTEVQGEIVQLRRRSLKPTTPFAMLRMALLKDDCAGVRNETAVGRIAGLLGQFRG